MLKEVEEKEISNRRLDLWDKVIIRHNNLITNILEGKPYECKEEEYIQQICWKTYLEDGCRLIVIVSVNKDMASHYTPDFYYITLGFIFKRIYFRKSKEILCTVTDSMSRPM